MCQCDQSGRGCNAFGDGVARVHGLKDVMVSEMLEFPNGVFGIALNLEQDSVGAVVLGDYLGLAEGQKVRCTGRILEVPVGPELLGRVVDPLGNLMMYYHLDVPTKGMIKDLQKLLKTSQIG